MNNLIWSLIQDQWFLTDFVNGLDLYGTGVYISKLGFLSLWRILDNSLNFIHIVNFFPFQILQWSIFDLRKSDFPVRERSWNISLLLSRLTSRKITWLKTENISFIRILKLDQSRQFKLSYVDNWFNDPVFNLNAHLFTMISSTTFELQILMGTWHIIRRSLQLDLEASSD